MGACTPLSHVKREACRNEICSKHGMSVSDAQQPAQPDDVHGVAVGRYALRTDAYDHALVVSSMEIEHWILREDDEFLLCVAPQHADAVRRELEAWERQREPETQPPELLPN